MDNEKYLEEVSKLKKIEEYEGKVYSIFYPDILISKDVLAKEVQFSSKTYREAPIVVRAESGERISIVSLNLLAAYDINNS